MYCHLEVHKELEVFSNCQAIKEHIVLRADAKAVPDQVHVCQDAVAIDHSSAFSGSVQTYTQNVLESL